MPADDAQESPPRDRKAEHIRLALDRKMQHARSAFDDVRLGHRALPEIDRAEIDLSAVFLGRLLEAPLLVSCMTGGTEDAAQINRRLAAAAEECGIAIGVGSQRRALEDPTQASTFQMRDVAPTVPLLANLGAVQLNYGFGIAECQRAVEMIGADALVLHLNPLQEAIQPEGQCNFSGLLPKIEAIVRALSVPLVVKEVGAGLSDFDVRQLRAVGVEIFDTAGVGGTSWARIEAARAADPELGDLFADWGISTPQSIQQLRRVPEITIIGSGGVRNGLDVAKAIALGADIVGMAFPLLEAAMHSAERVVERLQRVARELEIAMFCLGVRTPSALQRVPVTVRVGG